MSMLKHVTRWWLIPAVALAGVVQWELQRGTELDASLLAASASVPSAAPAVRASDHSIGSASSTTVPTMIPVGVNNAPAHATDPAVASRPKAAVSGTPATASPPTAASPPAATAAVPLPAPAPPVYAPGGAIYPPAPPIYTPPNAVYAPAPPVPPVFPVTPLGFTPAPQNVDIQPTDDGSNPSGEPVPEEN